MLIQKCNFSYTCFLRRAIAPRQLGLLYKSRQHYFSSIVENFRNATTNPASKYQIFISKTFDPFLNLSIEHFLLEETPADSTVLFLYVNSPCVVIGRNQNPWLETNMKLLKSQSIIRNKKSQVTRDNVQLVRRRSGGGAVFHDYGNVNYSVICPTANFSRDKYAEMVTQVIRQSNPRARVNERHDIVLDQGLFRGEIDQLDPADLHRTAYHIQGTGPLPLKVSGSAYKLIRKRSLHHGTCLVASSNLTSISRFLHSEAKPFMKARGVESVRSPIGNIHNIDLSDTNDHIFDFQTQVVQAFADMHGISHSEIAQLIQGGQESFVQTRNEYALGLVGDELRNITDVATGLDELKSLDWIYGQTPQFTVSSHYTVDNKEPPSLPQAIPTTTRVDITARSGIISSAKLSHSSDQSMALVYAEAFSHILEGTVIHGISSFAELVKTTTPDKDIDIIAVMRWLDVIFGK